MTSTHPSTSTVVDHLAVKPTDRDLAWIRSALQCAIELEHSTLPIYLTSMLSLNVQNYTTYNLLRSVVMEEMVHMAIACNMLAILGGRPALKNLSPTYPRTGLPGGAEPDVTAVMAKLSQRQLKNFMRIESPVALLPSRCRSEKYPSIGRFYAAIKAALAANAKAVEAAMKQNAAAVAAVNKGTIKQLEATSSPSAPSFQVGDDIGFTTFKYPVKGNPLKQLYDAIDEITQQGEGTTTDDLFAGKGSQDESSHFLRFAEIYYRAGYAAPGKKTKLSAKTLPLFFKGVAIPQPDVHNTLMVPSDGYAALLKLDPIRAKVQQGFTLVDQAYSGIMSDLDAMWNGKPSLEWPTFGDAVAKMAQLRPFSFANIIGAGTIEPKLIAQLPTLYPKEHALMATYTDLSKPVCYGPRFFNLNNSSQV
jgi:hypothetical protein